MMDYEVFHLNRTFEIIGFPQDKKNDGKIRLDNSHNKKLQKIQFNLMR